MSWQVHPRVSSAAHITAMEPSIPWQQLGVARQELQRTGARERFDASEPVGRVLHEQDGQANLPIAPVPAAAALLQVASVRALIGACCVELDHHRASSIEPSCKPLHDVGFSRSYRDRPTHSGAVQRSEQ